jgi:bifunctional DNA-binding transcriptional regulator/antitoxin component of YhaV-PrlF toxin-antitoxin module
MPGNRGREANEVGSVEGMLAGRGQVTVPRPTRQALKLGPSDRVRFFLRGDGTVVTCHAEALPAGFRIYVGASPDDADG